MIKKKTISPSASPCPCGRVWGDEFQLHLFGWGKNLKQLSRELALSQSLVWQRNKYLAKAGHVEHWAVKKQQQQTKEDTKIKAERFILSLREFGMSRNLLLISLLSHILNNFNDCR